MTYTIGLLRESLMTIEGSLLSKNLIIVILICLVFVVLNLVKDLRYEKIEELVSNIGSFSFPFSLNSL